MRMQDLRDHFRQAGFENVRTYIQSGNVILQSKQIEAVLISSEIADVISDNYGFKPSILSLPVEVLQQVIDDNPFQDAIEDPKYLHLFFLQEPELDVDHTVLRALQTEKERYHVGQHAAYLHLPGGIWKSKLGARLEKCLGVAATARNWRTANKLLALAAQ